MAFRLYGFLYLQIEGVLIGGPFSCIEDPKGPREMSFHCVIIKKARQDLRFEEILFIMYPEVLSAILVQAHELRFISVQLDAFITMDTKDEWLSLLKKQGFFGF